MNIACVSRDEGAALWLATITFHLGKVVELRWLVSFKLLKLRHVDTANILSLVKTLIRGLLI